jgi:hypothetical protein
MAGVDPHMPGHHPAVRHDDAGLDDDADIGASAIHAAPPVGEEVHMPGPSLIPILNAVGFTVALLGATTFTVVLIAGLILFLVTTVLWIRDTRREIASLPAEHGHH